MDLNKMIPKAGSANRSGDCISVCDVSDNQLFYGQFLCLPDFTDRVYHDDGRSAR